MPGFSVFFGIMSEVQKARLTTYTKGDLARLLNFADSQRLRRDIIAQKGTAFLLQIGWLEHNQRIPIYGVQKLFDLYGWPEPLRRG